MGFLVAAILLTGALGTTDDEGPAEDAILVVAVRGPAVVLVTDATRDVESLLAATVDAAPSLPEVEAPAVRARAAPA